MKSRPWIWIVIGYMAFITGITTMVVIAIKHRPVEVKIGGRP